ncbi:selenium-binding protein SBP56-related protein [Natronomonas sp. EA1]|uniref:selenium-binding protein SBP56-related protein n=1 Tax=Natronomonas sp. EA1 TaxID=3421655 RepID=UPI003EC06DE7
MDTDAHDHAHSDRTMYASPGAAATRGRRERVAYVACPRVGTPAAGEPDLLAVVDVDPRSETYQQVIDRVDCGVGDELHHFGWSACSSSCHSGLERRYLVVPGNRTSRLYVVDCADERHPERSHVVDPEDVLAEDLSAPHTVHCAPGGQVIVSMLGNEEGDGPGGFLTLDESLQVSGRWGQRVPMNYDFWYQPRKNAMLSTAWANPNVYQQGFDPTRLDEFGREVRVWDWDAEEVVETFDMGSGSLPLEVRFFHNPERAEAYVACALSGQVWYLREDGGDWRADPVIDVPAREFEGKPTPALLTDILLSMDDRYLFVSAWLHGEVRMYDVSDPAHPRHVDTVHLGGRFGPDHPLRTVHGGPQMLQCSLDGERLYWTTSLYSSWDDQFFPEEGTAGSVMVKADVDPSAGTMTLDPEFCVDFGRLSDGVARAHEIRWPDADCTSDVWV